MTQALPLLPQGSNGAGGRERLGTAPAPIINPTVDMEVWKMKRIWVIMINFFLVALPALAWAADPGEKTADFAAKQVKVAGLNAINYFFASSYNSSKMVFAIIVTLNMGVV
jgi:hypothetical protein